MTPARPLAKSLVVFLTLVILSGCDCGTSVLVQRPDFDAGMVTDSGPPRQYCGDGIVTAPEACDPGVEVGSTAPCNSDCTLNVKHDAGVADAAVAVVDAGMPPVIDAGTPEIDAGLPIVDAGQPVIDAGVTDAGTPEIDAGFDAGQPVIDAGVADAGTHGYIEWKDGGTYTWVVPPDAKTVEIWACGGGGAGGSVTGATGGGAACGRFSVGLTPGSSLTIEIAQGGKAPGNGGGYTGLNAWYGYLFILGGGGGGGNGCTAAVCPGDWGGKGGAGGDLEGKDGEHYFAAVGSTTCNVARGGKGGKEFGGWLPGGGGVGGWADSPSICEGGSGRYYEGGASALLNGVCSIHSGASFWRQGGSEPGTGGAGGSGYFGGGGGAFVNNACGGGGGGGASLKRLPGEIYEGDERNPGLSYGFFNNAGQGGAARVTPSAAFEGHDGYMLINW